MNRENWLRKESTVEKISMGTNDLVELKEKIRKTQVGGINVGKGDNGLTMLI